MQLRVDPEDVAAAATALSGVASRLDDALAAFVHEAGADAPQLGRNIADAATQGVTTTRQATLLIIDDIQSLAKALRVLATGYAALDATAMPKGTTP